MKLWTAILAVCVCLAFSAHALLAQSADDDAAPRRGRIGARGEGNRPGPRARQGDREEGQGRQRDGEQAGRRPHRPRPLLKALDTDKDGSISAAEIAAASASLLKLDKNGDGKIDRVELHPRRPRGDKDGDGPRAGKGPRDGDEDGDEDGDAPRRRRRPRRPRDGDADGDGDGDDDDTPRRPRRPRGGRRGPQAPADEQE